MRCFLLVAIAATVFPFRAIHAQSCMSADTSSSRIITTIQRIVTGTSKAAQTRAMLHLPSLSASQVTLVSNDTSCARARQAQDSLVHATNTDAPTVMPFRPLYVIKLGTYNALVDPTARSERDFMLGFFDPAWVYLGSIPVYLGHP
jgi:hypothetical protein